MPRLQKHAVVRTTDHDPDDQLVAGSGFEWAAAAALLAGESDRANRRDARVTYGAMRADLGMFGKF